MRLGTRAAEGGPRVGGGATLPRMPGTDKGHRRSCWTSKGSRRREGPFSPGGCLREGGFRGKALEKQGQLTSWKVRKRG